MSHDISLALCFVCFFFVYLGKRVPLEEGMATLPYSSVENPMDRGAWWAVIHRIAKSRTQLKQLSMLMHTVIFSLPMLRVSGTCLAKTMIFSPFIYLLLCDSMFCHNRGMPMQHTNQPVFETDGAKSYKKRAKRLGALIFFKKMKFAEAEVVLGATTNDNVNQCRSAENPMVECRIAFCRRC